jgi:hypothetical protein
VRRWLLVVVVACGGEPSRVPEPVFDKPAVAPAVQATDGMKLDARAAIMDHAVSSDGHMVAALTATGVVVWDVVRGTEVAAYPRDRGPVGRFAMAFTRDQRELVVASEERVDTFALAGDRGVRTTPAHLPAAQSMVLAPGAEHVAIAYDKQVELWAIQPLHRVQTWDVRWTIAWLHASTDGLRFGGDSIWSNGLISSPQYDHLVWDASAAPRWESLTYGEQSCNASFCGPFELAMAADLRSGVRVMGTGVTESVRGCGPHDPCCGREQFPSGFQLERFDVDTSKATGRVRVGGPGNLAITPDASRAAPYSQQRLELVDLARQQRLFTIAPYFARFAQLSRDGRYVVACDDRAIEAFQSSGAKLWTKSIGNRTCGWTREPLVVVGHRVFALDHAEGGGGGITLRGWNLETGEVALERKDVGQFRISPVIGDCVVLQTSASELEVSCEHTAAAATTKTASR